MKITIISDKRDKFKRKGGPKEKTSQFVSIMAIVGNTKDCSHWDQLQSSPGGDYFYYVPEQLYRHAWAI